jgi:hypothetical protein
MGTKFNRLIVGGVAAAGVGVALTLGSVAADAATAPTAPKMYLDAATAPTAPKMYLDGLITKTQPLSVVGDGTSQNLAGYSLRGNGGDRFRDLRATITVPAETSAVPAGTVGDGVVQATSVNGGIENGVAPVFDLAGSTCNANQWTLAYALDVTEGAAMPIPPGSLTPILDGGSNVCLGGGLTSTEFVELFYNSKSHFEHIQAGPTSSNQDVLVDLPDGGYHNFFSGGFGTDTTNGTAAAQLTNGSVVQVTGASVTQYNGHRRTIASLNLEEWIGTVTGGAPSVANPITLQPSAVSAAGTFTVTAP